MDETAMKRLLAVLKPEEMYNPAGLPSLDDPNDPNGEAEAFLSDELLEQSCEDGKMLSFFVVNETTERHTESRYVSPGLPSTEMFAKELLR